MTVPAAPSAAEELDDPEPAVDIGRRTHPDAGEARAHDVGEMARAVDECIVDDAAACAETDVLTEYRPRLAQELLRQSAVAQYAARREFTGPPCRRAVERRVTKERSQAAG